MTALTVFGLAILAFGLISSRAERGFITPAMAFVVFGFLIGKQGADLIQLELDTEIVLILAEITLAVVLFTDAARIDLKLLWQEHNLPLRLLVVGLPLTIVLGTATASWLFPHLNIWLAAALAVIVAPTDAALAHPVVTNQLVPVRIRQTISVESGLNDGICLPIFLLLLCGARAAGHEVSTAYWLRFTIFQITLGPVVGVAIGYVGGRLLEYASDRKWVNHSFLDLSALSLAVVSYGGAELIGGNGFIAAFCAGLTVGNCARHVCGAIYEFGEVEGQLLSLAVFMIVGVVIAPTVIDGMNVSAVVFAVLSLTVLRMLPVAISLLGTRLRPETLGFVGWFGPRGTASIVFAMILFKESRIPLRQEVFVIAMTTVLLSIFAHGLTAFPAARWYAHRIEVFKHAPVSAEHKSVTEMPFCCRATAHDNHPQRTGVPHDRTA